MKTLSGLVCATITPMKQDGGLDLASLEKLCDYLADNGVHGIYPNGTNGEGLLLSADERRRVAEAMVKRNAGRMSVYIQCTAVTMEETAGHMAHAQAVGADGVGVMTPVFFRQDDIALEACFDDLLASVAPDFPAYVYNIPSHSNNDVSPSLLGKIMARHGNVRGIKFSAPDLMRLEDYLACAGRSVDALIGCDSLFLQCLASGGVGTVSGPGMVFAKRFVRLYDQFRSGDWAGARETQMRIVATDRALAGIPGIPAIKTMLVMQGVIAEETCRKPFRALTDAERRVVAKEVEIYNREG
ncbi:MAG: dihydrodipicolinate synthase family protein [Planctomycetaceae bacterium]|nr:dihydrodipicolinate synthase family protein [Planctomycetaceae bacterium]